MATLSCAACAERKDGECHPLHEKKHAECQGRHERRRDHRDAAADEIRCKRRQPIGLIFRPAVFNRNVLALDIAACFGLWRPDHSTFSVNRHGRFRDSDVFGAMCRCERDGSRCQPLSRAKLQMRSTGRCRNVNRERSCNSLERLMTKSPTLDRKPPKVISPVDPCAARANKRVQFGYALNYLIDIEYAVPRWCHAWREMASPTQNGHAGLRPLNKDERAIVTMSRVAAGAKSQIFR